MTDKIFELTTRYNDEQAKHRTFLLSAAGACIGFSVFQADGLKLHWTLFFYVFACICWLSSFYYGINLVTTVNSLLAYNVRNLKDLKLMRAAQEAEDAASVQALREHINEKAVGADGLSRQALIYEKAQYWLLLIGGATFILWKLLQITYDAR